MTELYRGEAICKRWADSSTAGRTVTLQLEDGGSHPFRGYEGERFAIVVVPIGNDEKPMKKSAAPCAQTAQGGGDDTANGASVQADTPPPVAKPKKRWHEMPASQRAGMLVNDPEFWAYLGAACSVAEPRTTLAADVSLKSICGVDSKSSILPGTTAYEKFAALEGNFHAWRQAKQHGAA